MIAVRSITEVVTIGSVLNVVVLGDLVEEETKERSKLVFTPAAHVLTLVRLFLVHSRELLWVHEWCSLQRLLG